MQQKNVLMIGGRSLWQAVGATGRTGAAFSFAELTRGVPDTLRKIAEGFFPEGRQAIQFRDQLGELGPSIVVIWGDQDAIVDSRQAKGLPASVEVHILEGVGHMPQMEAAHEVNRLIHAHLEAADQ